MTGSGSRRDGSGDGPGGTIAVGGTKLAGRRGGSGRGTDREEPSPQGGGGRERTTSAPPGARGSAMAAPDELRFQEFEEAAELLSATPDATTPRAGEERPSHTAVTVGPEEGEPGDDTDTTELLGGQRRPHSFWTFEYYQAFFDVDTHQVLERIKGSVTPLPGKNFVRHRLRNNPDLSLLDLRHAGVCPGRQREPLPPDGEASVPHLPLQPPVPQRHHRRHPHLLLRLAGAAGAVGVPAVAAEPRGRRLQLLGDRLRLRLLPLCLRPHRGPVADPGCLAAVAAAGRGRAALGVGAGPHLLAAGPCRRPGNRAGRGGRRRLPAHPPRRRLQALLLPAAAERQPSPFTAPHHGGGRGAPQPRTTAPQHQRLPAGHPPCAVSGGVPGSRGSPRPWHRAPWKDVAPLGASARPCSRRRGPRLPCARAALAVAPLSRQLVSMQTDPNKPRGMSPPAPCCSLLPGGHDTPKPPRGWGGVTRS
ncbi:protein YIPF2 isoform X1 [Buteo buteo]|uniref:protein YIPF2 isoform X1 n=1 Tax=Buteo buteo TaxID=30397 RepID=UPI003EBEBA62